MFCSHLCKFLSTTQQAVQKEIVKQETNVNIFEKPKQNPKQTATPGTAKSDQQPVSVEYCDDVNGDGFCDRTYLSDGSTIIENQKAIDALKSSTSECDQDEDDFCATGGEDEQDSKTYCDVPNPSNPCHDRYDVSETTGLATCIDGSYEEDPEDCKGGGAEDDNDSVEDEEKTANCGGEPCTPTEKEDSTLDATQELECQEEDDFCEPGCESPSMDCIDDVNE